MFDYTIITLGGVLYIMKLIYIEICIFVLSLLCSIISFQLFYNIAVFADEFATSPISIYGGELENLTSWIQLLFTTLVTILSGIHLYYDIKHRF